MTRLQKNERGLSKVIMLILLGIIVVVVAVFLYIIFGPKGTPPPKRVSLTMWGVQDDSSDLAGFIRGYQAAHPYITITYVKKRIEEYEDALIKAWATDTGPDIYMLPNSWINKYRTDFITPMPASTNIAFYTTKKVLFKTETKIEYVKKSTPTVAEFKRNYIDLVYGDVVQTGKIQALPLGISTLVMYYNRALLNQAHLVEPPRTWTEFSNVVSKLTISNEQNSILRAGAALGTYNNIPHAADILTLLMLQNGTPMVTGNKVTFNQPTSSDSEGAYFPAEVALRYYTDFASPDKAVYTWNNNVSTSALDYFAQGNLEFLFGYRSQEAEIKALNSGLDYGIAPVPQINTENEVNYANYWTYTVAKKTKKANEAWAFLIYSADANRVKNYLKLTGQTSPIRSVLNEQLSDPDIGVFAQQALTSKSWYHGQSPQDVESVFGEMINGIVDKTTDVKQAVNQAVLKIQSSY